MNFSRIPAGRKIPEDIYVIIEIPAHSSPVKYEIDKHSGLLFVDRFIKSTMSYPCNYGYINYTLSLDQDPVDVLIPTPYPLHPKSVILGRPVGMLKMIDESGKDYKIIAVPHDNISTDYKHIKDINDCSQLLREQIVYFFEHYKDLEANKWVKIIGWDDVLSAQREIVCACNRFMK
ncbi:inorganic diphosphatase [Blochmannia endosymbiont of Camponotus (Colobopsis) obliquus]|uniref:inorganic diphosphatase n=1 Tax=Blochmannia endosymbiont of Camponotus (Colobopsis) obliquus TaxID=1505597 RepID=UPI00061A8985|nr:inorganic diphosphatase [Blochmannia endosymbiont of Camponotus (Colobopsis) obliquus]AKC60272.1 Inorganic pyrophosphatase [Blochmannia endosymbiont of Camponotus (Colobopsis) obliquus]